MAKKDTDKKVLKGLEDMFDIEADNYIVIARDGNRLAAAINGDKAEVAIMIAGLVSTNEGLAEAVEKGLELAENGCVCGKCGDENPLAEALESMPEEIREDIAEKLSNFLEMLNNGKRKKD